MSVQNPLRLNDYTEPQPDIVLRKRPQDRSDRKHPTAQNALLVLEVADTTFKYDREVKLAHYAKAGVAEVWIEDLQGDRLLVYRDPSGETFRTALTLKRGDTVSVLAFSDTTFAVDELLG